MFEKKWPAEHDNALRTMTAQGKTNGEIARLLNQDFGTSYTRNTVIGRASRMGLRSQSGDKGGDASPKPKRTRKRSPSADDKIKIAARSNLPSRYLRRIEPRPRVVCDAPPLAGDCGGISPRGVALVEVTAAAGRPAMGSLCRLRSAMRHLRSRDVRIARIIGAWR